MQLVPYIPEAEQAIQTGYRFVRNAETARDIYGRARQYYGKAKGYYDNAKHIYGQAKGTYRQAADFIKRKSGPVTDISADRSKSKQRLNSRYSSESSMSGISEASRRRRSSMSSRRSSGGGSGGYKHNAMTNKRTKVFSGKKKNKRYKKNTLKKRVGALEKNAPKLAVYDYRNINDNYCEHASNACAYSVNDGIDSNLYEGSADSLPVFAYATNSVTTADITGSTNNLAKIDYRYIFSKLTARNNGVVPIYVSIYLFRCTVDTSNHVTTLMDKEDSLQGVTYTNDILLYPTDFPLAMKSWKLEKHCKGFLQVGDQLELAYSQKRARYSPRETDINTIGASTAEVVAFHKGDTQWLVRTMGPISQDSTTDTNIGTAAGKVDIAVLRKLKIYYPSTLPYRKIETSNQFATNTGHVGAPDSEQVVHP